MTEAANARFDEELETATNEVIAACDGDPRSAVAALLAENAALERELGRLSARVSSGYARGQLHRGSGR